MSAAIINLAYLLAVALFVLGLKGLSHPRTAVRGNRLGATGMLIAIVATLLIAKSSVMSGYCWASWWARWWGQ
jgi:NAD/NADP transhydrogenase beta subunit